MTRGIYLSMPAVVQHTAPTDDTAAAFELGRTGAPATDAERRQFEAWMAGHCWACAPWNGSSYTDMATRVLWAAWRDRGALAQQQGEPVAPDFCSGCDMLQCRDAGRCAHPAATAPVAQPASVPQEVRAALFDCDDHIARMHGDDRGGFPAVEVLRRFLDALDAAPAPVAQPSDEQINKMACAAGFTPVQVVTDNGAFGRLARAVLALRPVAQPLTDERIDTISDEVFDLIDGIPDDLVGSRTWDRMFARAIERAHKIGGKS